MKKEGDEWIEDPDKECCYKASFSGSYTVDVPVSITVPVAADKNGKNGGLCVIGLLPEICSRRYESPWPGRGVAVAGGGDFR